MKAGTRIFTLQRLVNVRDGHGRHTDALPRKMTIPAKEGFRAGKVPVPIEPQLDKYYAMRRWDTNGIPTKQCLKEIGLSQYSHVI